MSTEQNYAPGNSHAIPTSQTVYSDRNTAHSTGQTATSIPADVLSANPELALIIKELACDNQVLRTDIIYSAIDQAYQLGKQANKSYLAPKCELTSEWGNPATINNIRQDLRAWFMTCLPVWDNVYTTNSMADSVENYNVLDSFLSELLLRASATEKGGVINE